ncbi:hypothetical protein JMG10_08450 [Nostoc ellipsosporum NOK]|nr:hypothetical protein [Nostoc ellipsosporum NOK]
MSNSRHSALLRNYIIVAALFILVLNDHFLKWTFHNTLTGKLSDFAGVLLLPFVISYLLKSRHFTAIILTAIFFTWWKSPLSSGFIDWYNTWALIPITRVVDYTDLVALIMLLPAYKIMQRPEVFGFSFPRLQKLHPALLLIPVSFALMATAPPYSYYLQPGGDVYIGKKYRVRGTPDEVLAELRANGFNPQREPDTTTLYRVNTYRLDNVVLEGDTVQTINFGLMPQGRKTYVFVNYINLNGYHESNWRKLRRLSKHWHRVTKKLVFDK